MPRRYLPFFILPAVILAVALSLQVFASVRRSPPRPAPSLAGIIPTELPGWTGRELPLGETEELKNQVAATLRFDEHVSRLFTRGGVMVTLYAAYWRPDKVPPRAVGVHTPDTCWIQNGWTRLDRTSSVPLSIGPGLPLKPAEFGVYSLRGNTQHVYFWHLVGGQAYSYEQDGLHSLVAPFQDMVSFGLEQKQEQLFVRLASNVPFPEIWNDPGLATLLSSLARLGVGTPPAPQS